MTSNVQNVLRFMKCSLRHADMSIKRHIDNNPRATDDALKK
jgi:hypothetical protein